MMEDLRNTVIREHRQLRNAIRQERMTKFFFFFFVCYSGTTAISLAMTIRDVAITDGVLNVVVVPSSDGRSCGRRRRRR